MHRTGERGLAVKRRRLPVDRAGAAFGIIRTHAGEGNTPASYTPTLTKATMTQPPTTETVVRTHLQAFIEQKGVAAIVSDYEEEAVFLSEDRAYRGKREIQGFFEHFIAALPPKAISRFTLRSLRVAGEVAYITWSAGEELPLGTDTFVVRDGKIVSQTFAMYAAPALK